MKIIPRIIQLPDITKNSVFIWGPRKVGKSLWLSTTYPNFPKIDLLQTEVFAEYASRPQTLRERFADLPEGSPRKPIIIDEVQKVPALLDEVQWLMTNREANFILTGSSARKLRTESANMLGGRARRREMKPFCFAECPELDPEKIVISGLIPTHFMADDPIDALRGYAADYLKEEIAAEASTRDIPSFVEFLRVAALTSGELINYTNIARETGIKAKVVREHFSILEDTLLGFRVAPWKKSNNRKLIETEKFYLFDVGVSNYLARRTPQLGTPEFGKSFEHFLLMELKAFQAYKNPELEIRFWRTTHKQEVDFILNDMQVAIEVKASMRIDESDAKGLRILAEEQPVRRRILVSMLKEPKYFSDKYGRIEVLPFREFLKELWGGGVL